MIQVFRQGRHWVMPLWRAQVEACVRAMLDQAGAGDASLELLLADDAELARLNSCHLGLTGPTNVLAFPAEDEGGDESYGGESSGNESLGLAAVSLEAVLRESLLFGQDPATHLARLLAHGLLHLLGLDHGPHMEEETERLLDAGRGFLL